jgi:hypothetical protein
VIPALGGGLPTPVQVQIRLSCNKLRRQLNFGDLRAGFGWAPRMVQSCHTLSRDSLRGGHFLRGPHPSETPVPTHLRVSQVIFTGFALTPRNLARGFSSALKSSERNFLQARFGSSVKNHLSIFGGVLGKKNFLKTS